MPRVRSVGALQEGAVAFVWGVVALDELADVDLALPDPGRKAAPCDVRFLGRGHRDYRHVPSPSCSSRSQGTCRDVGSVRRVSQQEPFRRHSVIAGHVPSAVTRRDCRVGTEYGLFARARAGARQGCWSDPRQVGVRSRIPGDTEKTWRRAVSPRWADSRAEARDALDARADDGAVSRSHRVGDCDLPERGGKCRLVISAPGA